MDDDVLEMTREELLMFIRDSVNQRQLISENMRKKSIILQSLFEQYQKQQKKQSECLDWGPECVSLCEAVGRQLYSHLGWEYDKTDTEGNNCKDSASSSATYDETDDVRSPSPVENNFIAVDSDESQTEERSKTPEEQPKAAEPTKELKVLLHRLPMELRPRRTPRPSTSKQVISDDELSNADSDYQPSGGSSASSSTSSSGSSSDGFCDSDFSLASSKSDQQKRKKFKSEKVSKTDPKETAVSQATPVQPSTPVQTANANGSNKTNSTGTTQNVKSEVTTEAKPFAVSEKKPDGALPKVLEELKVGMRVLAKRKKLRWETGKVTEIVEKEDGTKKFKVTFEDKGKVLVSGHHIAYDAMPKLSHLTVGSRVVSKYDSNNTFFSPGILGELPSRKNRMRFLMFFDDQKTMYVALPVLRLVSKPLPDPLDDIRDDAHKNFVKEYLHSMPYPGHTQFQVGQKINVERNGVFESCTVVLLDCSLMEVVYAKDEEKEWIYRGSIRLEYVINMKQSKK